MSINATAAPRAANPLAAARPMPSPAPVTIATFPVKSVISAPCPSSNDRRDVVERSGTSCGRHGRIPIETREPFLERSFELRERPRDGIGAREHGVRRVAGEVHDELSALASARVDLIRDETLDRRRDRSALRTSSTTTQASSTACVAPCPSVGAMGWAAVANQQDVRAGGIAHAAFLQPRPMDAIDMSHDRLDQ